VQWSVKRQGLIDLTLRNGLILEVQSMEAKSAEVKNDLI